jgi:selT/selW/selH-like putative selenoprotein
LQDALQRHGGGRLGLIEGELYPPTVTAQVLSQLLSYTFFIGFFLILLGEWFFTSLLPSDAGLRFVRLMKNNQMISIMVLFACNMAASSLISTGAFEVTYNGQLVHSKLATGHAPDIGHLLDIFKHFDASATPAGAIDY